MSIVGSRVILVVIFDARSSLGLVRLRVKKASEELAQIFEQLSLQKAGARARRARSPRSPTTTSTTSSATRT